MPQNHAAQSHVIAQRTEMLRARCRERGLAFTQQRLAVLEAVVRSSNHPTAEAVHNALKPRYPSLSRATVYKALDTLAALGVIAKVAPPGIERVAARYDGHVGRHHHAVCRRCARVIDIEEDEIRGLRLPHATGFRVEDYSINFFGACTACAGDIPSEGDTP